MKRIKKVAIIIGIVSVLLFFLFFHYKERDSYSCPVCFSRQHVFQWRLGFWMGVSLPLTPAWQITEESKLLGNIIDEKHQHNWEFYQGSPYYFFGTTWGGCALGGGKRDGNDLVKLYNEEQGFRDLVKEKIVSGKLSRERFLELCTFDKYYYNKDEKTLYMSLEYYELLDAYRDKTKK